MCALERHHTPLSTRTVFLITFALGAIVLAVGLFWDFGYDQGTFAYGGNAILHGQYPYRDFWDIKPPNIFYTYAAALGFFGNSVFAVRLFDYLNALIVLTLLFLLAMRMWTGTRWGRLAAVMSCAAFVLHYFILGYSDTAQAETYALPWILTAILLILPERDLEPRNETIRLLLSGFAIAVAFFFKYTNGVFLALGLAMLWINSGKQKRSHTRQALLLCAGFLIGFGAQTLQLALTGGLQELWHITTSATLNYNSNNYSGDTTVFHNLRTALFNIDLLWVIVAIIGWSFWGADYNTRSKHTDAVFQSSMTLLLACLLTLFAVQIQNKFYLYHYTVLYPWADILIGAGIAHFIIVLRKIDTLPRSSNTFIVIVALFALSYFWTSHSFLQQRVEELTEMSRNERPVNGSPSSEALAQYVSAHTTSEDTIFVFGFQPYVYWKTGRKPSTRFINTIHFKPSYVAPEERQELVNTLTQHPPALFLVETQDHYTSQGDNRDDSRTVIAKSYPEIEQLLQTRYMPRDTISDVICYFLHP